MLLCISSWNAYEAAEKDNGQFIYAKPFFQPSICLFFQQHIIMISDIHNIIMNAYVYYLVWVRIYFVWSCIPLDYVFRRVSCSYLSNASFNSCLYLSTIVYWYFFNAWFVASFTEDSNISADIGNTLLLYFRFISVFLVFVIMHINSYQIQVVLEILQFHPEELTWCFLYTWFYFISCI